MLIELLKSKIHRAVVTGADLHYEGSITIDRELMEAAKLRIHEKVAVWNVSSGRRFETYVIEGAAGSGEVCVNGAAAHLANEGDIVIIASFAWVDGADTFEPRVVRVDEQNRLLANDSAERGR